MLQYGAQLLLSWYASHFRTLPWRNDPTPYRVWISEIMLQQTRIEAVLPYYERFLHYLPDVPSLAQVQEDELLKLWEGLGYYSRARNLQKAANILVNEYNGALPADYHQLLALPGIGEYTAGAIASICFSIPVPAVDGNVMRVLARLTGDDTDVLSTGAKKHFIAIAEQMLPKDQPGRFNQALMELGETVCLPNTQPDCCRCPLQEICVACAGDLTRDLPVRSKKKPRRIERRTVDVIIIDGTPRRVLLRKRPTDGLLAGLWELPNALSGDDTLPNTLERLCSMENQTLLTDKHVFSHVEWHMQGRLRSMSVAKLPDGYRAATLDEVRSTYALPSAFRAFAAVLPQYLCEEAI